MDRYKTIIHQYCPILAKNVAIEKILDFNDTEKYDCLNKNNCNCDKGICNNSLISSYNINSYH